MSRTTRRHMVMAVSPQLAANLHFSCEETKEGGVERDNRQRATERLTFSRDHWCEWERQFVPT